MAQGRPSTWSQKQKVVICKAASITFIDAGSQDEAWVGVRYDENNVVLALSLKTDGDMAVVMSKENARKLIEALEQATS